MDAIKVFCPASVANVSCGFDLLGFSFKAIGDELAIKKIATKEIIIKHLDNYQLPLNPTENVAGRAAIAFLEKLEEQQGLEITIKKNIHPGSGIGSSAASASGTVFALQELYGNPFTEIELIELAMEGEYVASKSYHADNVAPALLGGMLFVRGYQPLNYIKLPIPKLYCTIISPQITVRTADARRVLKTQVNFKEAITQAGNLGGFISALYTDNYELMQQSLIDVLVEPQRADLIPDFHLLKERGMLAGALGVGISGSGPSVFALAKNETDALTIKQSFEKVYNHNKIPYKTYWTMIDDTACQIIE